VDLIYGSALWGAATKVNCHHIAERLAEHEPVLFVESVGARRPRAREWRRLLPRLARSLWPLRRVRRNLWVHSPLPLPFYRGQATQLSSQWVGLQVAAITRLRRWTIDACWVFHPMGVGTAHRARARAVIYYCVDDHASNPGVDPDAIRALEADLVREADLTIVTGEPLARRLRSQARALLALPNVADTELFGYDRVVASHPVLEAIDRLPRPRIGYLGNLAAYKIDVELVYEIARRRPQWSIVLVGPRNQGDTSIRVRVDKAPANVFFGSEVQHAFAPAVIDRFDVCLLPSAHHEVMVASFPLKFFEYLLRGRPVVARPLPSLQPFRRWYDEAVTADEFVATIETRLASDSPTDRYARQAYARAFGWHERMHELERVRQTLLDAARPTRSLF
jgi:glycosyl transferase family 1